MALVIGFEGLDGMGKTTLIKKVYDYMDQHPSKYYRWISITKEPGSFWTGHGPFLRDFILNTPDLTALQRELLCYVDASIHKRFLEVQEHGIYLSDRSKWTHLAYVYAYHKLGRLDEEAYEDLLPILHHCCYVPDVVIYLKGSLELMEERSKDKKKDAIESLGKSYFQFVNERYEELRVSGEHEGIPLLTLDASVDIDSNCSSVVSYLNDVFRPEELRSGRKIEAH